MKWGSSRREKPSPPAVSKSAAVRLSLYLRALERLEQRGKTTTSSKELGDAVGVTAAQVRKDLGAFGQLGFPGVGYKVAQLIPPIRRILGTDRPWHVALVGIGNLGSALVQYGGFQDQDFHFTALFDIDREVVGTRFRSLLVHHVDQIPEVVPREKAELGVIAVPAAAAQDVADRLVRAGIQGIFNFAPAVLTIPAGVGYVSIDLAVQLEQLSFFVSHFGERRAEPSSSDEGAVISDG